MVGLFSNSILDRLDIRVDICQGSSQIYELGSGDRPRWNNYFPLYLHSTCYYCFCYSDLHIVLEVLV